MKLSGSKSLPTTALLLLLLSLPSSSALAQTPAPAQEGETFFESIDVEVVNVEVYVTDRQGRPVTGLGRDDFQLFEDGKPVAITNFYAVAGESAAPAAPPAPAVPQASAATPAAPEASPVPEEQRLYVAVFVDDRNLTPAGRNQVLRQAQTFFAGRPRGLDRLVLVTYNGSLQVRQSATEDPAALSRALEQAAREVPRGAHGIGETRRLLTKIAQTAVPEDASDLAGIEEARQLRYDIESYAQGRQSEIRATLGSLGELVDWLAGLPPVLVKFSLSDLVLVPHDALYEGRVRIYVAARDERGRNSPVTELKVPVRVPKDQLRAALAKQAGFVVNVQLRSGRNRLAVTVLDDVGKISSTATASYPPGGEAEAGREGR